MSRKRLIYLPLEPYKERSTEYMSVEGGVYETCFKEAGIDFLAIRPPREDGTFQIKSGFIGDLGAKMYWGYSQMSALVHMMQSGEINLATDAIYLEDFWTPGFEMIPYAQHILYGNEKRNHIPVYAFCHAQTVDPHDFTYPMRLWMRPMEQGWAEYLSGIMVASKEIIPQMREARWPTNRDGILKVHACGLGFNIEALYRLFDLRELEHLVPLRKKRVLFTSRFDKEKNPLFFLGLAKMFPEVEFAFCSGFSDIRSSEPYIEEQLKHVRHSKEFPNVKFYMGMEKKEYYRLLKNSWVQFNCADQDYISYSLLDAVMMGCMPLYPEYLTFPDALNNNKNYLYKKDDLKSAAEKLSFLLKVHPSIHTFDLRDIVDKYQKSVSRMLRAMEFDVAI